MTSMTVGELKAYLANAPNDALVLVEARPAKGPAADDDGSYDLADVESFVPVGQFGSRPIARGEDASGKRAFVVLRISLDASQIAEPQ
jgi:hypothetical protein